MRKEQIIVSNLLKNIENRGIILLSNTRRKNMFQFTKLSKEVDKHLKKQAVLDEKSEKIIDLFLKEHGRTEIYGLIDYVVTCGAPKHFKAIDEFKTNYDENHLSVKDIKTYLDILDVHKESMKSPKSEKKVQQESALSKSFNENGKYGEEI